MDLKTIEDKLLEVKQVECTLEHKFAEGLYTRILHIPAGTLIIGKRHRNETLNILLKGKMTIYEDDDGSQQKVVEAPYIFTGAPLSKKAGLAHEDSIWVNVHSTTSTDLSEIEREVIISEDDYVKLLSTPSYKQLQFDLYDNKDVACLG